MHCASIKTVIEAFINYRFFAFIMIINSCYSCDVPSSCVHYLSTLQIRSWTQLPESHEFLKALGLIMGVAVVMTGVKQLQKILIEIDKQDRKQLKKECVQLPDTLYERIHHRIGNLDKKIKQEIVQRERLLTLQYPKEESTKKIILAGEQISSEEKFYDKSMIKNFANMTGCLILDLPRHREK